jgi:hypothetical protein
MLAEVALDVDNYTWSAQIKIILPLLMNDFIKPMSSYFFMYCLKKERIRP